MRRLMIAALLVALEGDMCMAPLAPAEEPFCRENRWRGALCAEEPTPA